MRHNVFLQKQERHRKIHELRAKGLSIKQICSEVGVNRVSVWRHLRTKEVVVPRRRLLSLERLKIAQEMKASGATYKQIGDHFGFSAASALELLRAAPNTRRKGICSLCGNYDVLDFHHTDYKANTYVPVCRPCHIKHFHADSTAKATAARKKWLEAHPRPPKPKIGRMGPAPRLLDGKTAKEMAVIWGVGLHQAQLRMAKILGPRWVRCDKGIPQKSP